MPQPDDTPSELDQLTEPDTTPSYVDGPQPGAEPPSVSEVFYLDEAAQMAESMFATHGEEGR